MNSHLGQIALVPSPSLGRWYPLRCSGRVEPGDTLGEVRVGEEVTPVRSPHRAQVVEVLAQEGHPVESGRPLVWLSLAG